MAGVCQNARNEEQTKKQIVLAVHVFFLFFSKNAQKDTTSCLEIFIAKFPRGSPADERQHFRDSLEKYLRNRITRLCEGKGQARQGSVTVSMPLAKRNRRYIQLNSYENDVRTS